MTLELGGAHTMRRAPLPVLPIAEHRMAMPAPPPAARRWTVPEVRALNRASGSTRYELVDGELLVTPGPSWSHQAVVGQLHVALAGYLRTHRVGYVFMAPADVEPFDGSLVQPDLFVTPLVDGRRPRDWAEAGRLLLAVEVVSPSSARADRVTKRRLYQRMRVPEYWVVDLDARVVERWRPDDARPEVVDGMLPWQPEGAAEALAIEVGEVLAE